MFAIGKITAPIALLLLLSGCWDRVELNDLSLITAIAFDKPQQNNSVEVTAQIIIPKVKGGGDGGTGGGGGGQAKQTVTRTASGSDIADAISKLQMVIPRKIFWGQCKVFIFGEEIAREGIREHMDFLLRHPQPRERGYVFVSRGRGADVLELFPPIERSSSEVIRELAQLGIGLKVTLEQLSIRLKGESGAQALPLVHILPKSKSSKPFETIAYLSGTAVFKDGKMIGELSSRETRGVLWVRNEIDEYTVTYENDPAKGKVSIHPLHAKVKLVPRIEDGTWKMDIKVRTAGDLVQNGTPLNPMDPQVLKKMEEGMKKDIQARIRDALKLLQRDLNADILDFANAYHRKYPKIWAEAKDEWETKFPEIEATVDVEARINRPGMVNSPGGISQETGTEK
ncbi:Ger(x)C family spore germination protein [Cohnella thailandensis]|uniref:Ger(X)C family spore germination protein n=1 Tax=Cohnella thailandensis TaxID=557557 RepID=A0A841SZS8_9BACL|nr:Ger(x)C family spore germination protein [Cohnella thailandensis]MBB6635137.1 Ger(x)C family spore germination protein [Cohnella thailandensis]MBP1974397.1 spore germination protein KC [Cohnella thailandensis]